MKMKEQLDSAQPLKKHKTKTKKSELKKKQAKLDTKKESKEQKHHKENTSKKTLSADVPKKQYKINSVVTKPEEAKSSNTLTRQRASKNLQPMSKEEQLIAINLSVNSTSCEQQGLLYRLDTPSAREFLSQFGTLP